MHYRDGVTYSKAFVDLARSKLVEQGFTVATPSKEGVNRVQDTASGNAEGPHVDWFQKPGDDAAVQAAQVAANRVVAILNDIPRDRLGAFTPKADGWPRGAGPNQARYLGVWF